MVVIPDSAKNRNSLKEFIGKIIRKLIVKSFLISYPKSGRTWIRVILSKYSSTLYNVKINLDLFGLWKQNHKIPYFKEDETKIRNRIETQLKNKRIILLVRDPRDITVSFYFHATKRSKEYKGSLSDFIRNKKIGINKTINFINEIYKHREQFKDFLLVRYEDLRKDTTTEIRKILYFLGLKDINRKALTEAILFSSFENMKKLEKSNALQDVRLKPAHPDDPESYKVRRGKIGGYRDYLNSSDINYLNV